MIRSSARHGYLCATQTEAFGRGERLVFEGEPGNRQVDIDAAGHVREEQYLIRRGEGERVRNAWHEIATAQGVDQGRKCDGAAGDGDIDVPRQARHTASNHRNPADDHRGCGDGSQRQRDGAHGLTDRRRQRTRRIRRVCHARRADATSRSRVRSFV